MEIDWQKVVLAVLKDYDWDGWLWFEDELKDGRTPDHLVTMVDAAKKAASGS